MITKHIWTNVCLLAIMMTISSFVGTRTVFADGWSGENDSGGSHTDTGNCSKNGDWDSCGAGFIRMDVNDPNPTRLISNWTGSGYEGTKAYITNTVVPACKKVGASEFYLLVLHVFQGGKPTGTFGLTRKVGDLITGYEGAQNWMGTRYRPGSNALAFSEVLANYKYARYTYAPAHPEQNWGDFLTKPWSNVTAFCWNPKWKTEEAETSFGAFSIVVSDEVNNGSRNSTYPTQDSKKTWEITSNEDKVRVTFAHKFFYYGGNKLSSNTTEQASTNWEVMVTRDGKGYYEPDHVGAIDGITFQGTYSVPGYNKNASFSGSDGSGCPGNICNEDVGVNTYDIDISNLKLGESTVVCSEISYDPKAFLWRSENGNPFKIIKRTNANKSSTGCVKITRGAGEDVEFWSNSSAEASHGSKVERTTSPVDGDTNLTIRLDENNNDPVTVRFWHNVHYTGKIPENIDKDICTTFSFKSDSEIKAPNPPTIIDESNINGSQYCANKHESMSKDVDETDRGNENDAVGKGSSVVINDIQPGAKKVVCQTISYTPKNFLILQDEKNNTSTADDGSGSGSSTACVTITKEKETDPPQVEIKLDNDVYYAGETAHLTWEVKADSNYKKKLLQGVMFYYQAPVNVDPSSAEGIMTEKANRKDPQSWFGDQNDGFRDGHYQTVDFTPGFEHSFQDPNSYKLKDSAQDSDGAVYHSSEIEPSMETISFNDNKTIEIVVPDNVGDKICVGFATHYQNYKIEDSTHKYTYITGYYRGQPQYNTVDHTIHKYVTDGEDYWLIEGATCRPIVKKPALSIWNGSTSAAQNITTSVSNRYTKGFFGLTEEVDPSNRHKFGSWVEYLAVVNGAVETGGGETSAKFGFSSGASYAYLGAKYASELLVNNSPLTIANKNVDKPGHADIASSSTFLSRLSTYLSADKASTTGTQVYSDLASGINATGSRIVRMSGDIAIDDSIIVKNTNANSIYQIPQLIIYTDGNINIGPNVERIDAWLIAGGKINTCSSYEDSKTEAAVATDEALPISGQAGRSTCSKQLTINGPVIAKSITLNRTAGSDPLTYKDVSKLSVGDNTADSRSITAEIFNLSADTYLWGYAQASRYSSSYTEAYSRELPPRY